MGVYDDAAHDLEALESLLRQLGWCRTAGEASRLVAATMPGLTGAREAILLLAVAGDLVRGGGGWRTLAAAAMASGAARSEVVGSDAAVAVPLAGFSRPAGVLVLVHPVTAPLGERACGVVRLFADHAGSALRRLALAVPA